MSDFERQARLDQRVRMLKNLLVPLLLLSVFGTYLALSYSYLLESAPLPLSVYADPIYASLEIWYLYGLTLLLTAYYIRLRTPLTRRQTIILAVLFLLLPPASYIYLMYLWFTRRQTMIPHEPIERAGP